MSAAPTADQIAARLDRLPFTRWHRRFLARISLGAWFDYYDNFVAGTLAVALPAAGILPDTGAEDWFSPLGLFMAALPLGMFLGSLFLGSAVDYVGRRVGFIVLLLLYSLASLIGGAAYYPLAGAAGATAGLALLVGTRLLAGMGIGAENVVIDAYVSEVVPHRVRGRCIAFTQAVAFTAFPVAALLGRVLAPKAAPEGWWLLLVIGSLGALLSWYFRRNLPESPRWSAAAGRPDEAAKAVALIEQAVEQETGRLPPVPATVAGQPAPRPVDFRQIWSRRYRGRTVLLLVFHLLQTIGYYGFMHWLAKLLIAKGWAYDDALTMQFAASLGAPLGPLLALWTIERWERKWLITGLALFLAAAVVGFGLAGDAVLVTVLAGGIILGCNWFSAVFHAYHAELFPTEARGSGIGFTYAGSRLSMVGLDYFMPGLLAVSWPGAVGLMAAAFAGVAVAIGGFGPRTNARALEEISG